MRRLVFVILFAAILASSGTVLAEEAGRDQGILKLLEVTNARNMSDQIMKSMFDMMEKQFQTVAAGLPPESREDMEALRKEIVGWIRDNLSWDQMKDMYVDVYTQVFTEKEIDELINFYQSPLGQKMLAKMPELIQATMQRSQAMIQKKLPEFKERLTARLSEIEAKYQNKSR